MAIRLIALDLDGTALTSARWPHPALLAAVETAEQVGIEVVAATGRNIHSARRVMEGVGWNAHLIAGNGCLSFLRDGTLLHTERLHPDVVDQVIHYAERTGAYIHAESTSQLITCFDRPERLVYQRRSGIEVHLVSRADMVSAPLTHLLLITPPDQMAHHQANLGLDLNGSAHLLQSEKDYLEILPNGVSKVTGLTALCKHLGIKSDEVAALGDYDNDLPMLGWVGFPAAVENCTANVRGASKRVFSRNDEGGAAEFIRWIVYNGRAASG